MADSMIQSSLDIINRNKNYASATDFDPTINRWAEKDKYDAQTEDKGTLSFTDMLSLMVAQFQNQTMDNQASTTDMMNQLTQMTSMQAMNDMVSQMKELTLANVMSYSASLVGQTVTIGIWNTETKKLEEIVGVVEGAGTYDGQQVIFVNGKSYALSSIMAVGKLPPRVDESEDPDDTEEPGEVEDPDDTEEPGEVEDPDGTDTENKDDKVEQAPDSETKDSQSADETGKVEADDNAVG